MRYLNQYSLLVLAVCGLSNSVVAQETAFRFNPPDGTTYTETFTRTRVKTMGPSGSQTEVGKRQARMEITKTADGYTLVATPLSAQATRNGQVVEHPMEKLLLETIITYELTAEGRLRAVRGFEQFLERLKSHLPPEVAQSVSSLMNEETIRKLQEAEWNGRIGKFIGQPATVGQTWSSVEEFELPQMGTILYDTRTSITEALKCGAADCVRMKFSYANNPESVKEFLNNMMSQLGQAAGRPEAIPMITSVDIAGGGERVIDPATMLIYSERTNRTISMTLDVPNQGPVTTTMQEDKVYEYNYSNPTADHDG